jgi:hypothetical protein
MNIAVLVGAVAVGLGALAAFAIPGRDRRSEAPVGLQLDAEAA